jgi:ribosomal protein S27E
MAREEGKMPYVTCPTCGERGKIPSSLIGARIKCRKCGLSFLVSPPSGKVAVGAGVATGGHASATAGPSAAVEVHGIEVEGLDASSWAVPTESTTMVAPTTPVEVETPATGAESGSSFAPVSSTSPAPAREYKLLSSRDKYFDGKFDLARLEEALNHYARLGWVAKSMSVPHFKGYSGALEEVVVVLLERCDEMG